MFAMFAPTNAMKRAKLADVRAAEYFAEVSRLSAVRGQVASPDGRVAQPPLLAVRAQSAPDPIEPRRVNAELKLSRVTVSAPAATGAPVNLTMAEFRRLKKEDQARIMRQVLAFDGARERMAPDGSGRSLADAFEAELSFQRAVVRSGSAAIADGKSDRVSKSAAKRDTHKGYRKMKDAGQASFKRSGTRYSGVSTPNGVDASTRPLKLGETGILRINALETVTHDSL